MNRAIIEADQTVTEAMLPPAKREPDAPLRVLFMGVRRLGFKTTSSMMESYADARADFDAVHWYPEMSLFDRLWMAPTPLSRWNLDLRVSRALQSASRMVRRGLGPVDSGRMPLERFDVVHVMTQQLAQFMHAVPIPPGCKVVIHADATVQLYKRWFNHPPFFAAGPAERERRVLSKADGIECISAWTLDSVRDDLRIPASKLTMYRPCPTASSTNVQPPSDPSGLFRIIFVGNDWERKGGARLLRWHQSRWIGKAELHVCSGKAPIDRSLKGVVWHGPTPHAKLIGEILPSMHLLALPTVADTFVIAVAEAHAAGVPVVTSRLAGMQELVRDGVTGLLCDRDDDDRFIAAIERIMNDRPLRDAMANAAKAHAQRNLNPDVWHTHLFDQFHRIAEGKPIQLGPPSIDPATLSPSPPAPEHP